MDLDTKKLELIVKTEGISLEEVDISNRLYNCLRRGGYNNLQDVVLAPRDKFTELKNFGKTSKEELFQILEFVENSNRDEIVDRFKNKLHVKTKEKTNEQLSNLTVLEVAFERKIDLLNVTFCNNGVEDNDVSISNTNLPKRSKKILEINGIDSLRTLSLLEFNKMVEFKGMGKDRIDDVLKFLRENSHYTEKLSIQESERIKDIVNEICSYFIPVLKEIESPAIKEELAVEVIKVFSPDITMDMLDYEYYGKIAQYNPIKNMFKRQIMLHVSDSVYVDIPREKIVHNVAKEDSRFFRMVDYIIEDMIDERSIRVIGKSNLYKYKLFLGEWFETLTGNGKDAFELRCKGLTLDETGKILGLTRERVRQIVDKTIKNCPEIYEKDYIEIIKRYNFSKDEFRILLDLSMFQVNYLFQLCKSGDGDIESFLMDNTIPERFKDRVPIAFRDKVLIIDGKCIPLKREVLLKELLKTFCADQECNVDEFMDYYEQVLVQNEISDKSFLLFPSKRAFEARITDYPYVLSKSGRRIRFYDTMSIDINDLLEALDVERYNNTEISTLKLFRDFPEVMEQYDIRDEYELHNIIRKKENEIEYYNIKVTRMPSITIGVGNREEQVEELLFQMAPISNIELAQEYERIYGVKAETVLANYFKCIDIYYHNGVFDLEKKDLSEFEYAELQGLLNLDFYLWEEIVQIYHSISGGGNSDAINAMTLKKLGFKVYSQYVVRADYLSAESYFKELLLRERIIDLNNLANGIKSIQTFYSALSDLRDTLDLIEVDKDIFYRFDYFSDKYNFMTKDELNDLGIEVLELYAKYKYFSVDIISRTSEILNVSDILKNTYILNSIIRSQQGIKTGKIGNVYIASKEDNELTQMGLITYVIEENGEMSVNDLINYLKEEFGLKLDRSRILYVLTETKKLIYDTVFDYVCERGIWKEYNGPIYLTNTRFAYNIEKARTIIDDSKTMIAKIFWKDRYTKFVDYCGMNECFYMKDLLALDFRKIYENTDKLNLSHGGALEVANIFLDWVSNLNVEEQDQGNNSILDMFFK